MRLLTVVGARPQFIKAAALSPAIAAHNAAAGPGDTVEEVMVHTGQHYDFELSEVFFRQLALPRPHHHLGVGSGRHGAQTGRMLQELEPVLIKENPDVVLVYGDTNSTLAGALAAAKLQIPIAHVEAGLRSGNRRMPEETNRVLADHVATWLFCPTETAVRNLAREGITAGVHLVGDVMYEVLREHAPRAASPPCLARLGVGPYAVATVHRAENTEAEWRLRAIFAALERIATRLPVICLLHPRTRGALDALGYRGTPHLHLTGPASYLEMLALERDARLVLTDSGGVQKEAHWLGVPCVTLRDETEWVETLEGRRNVLAGADPERIVSAAEAALARPRSRPPSVATSDASATIVRLIDSAPAARPGPARR